MATDGPVNNHSPTLAHWCTNTHQRHTLCHTTKWKCTTDTYTVIDGGVVKTDGKRVNGVCDALEKSAPGGDGIPLVSQHLTSINTSAKLLGQRIIS